MKLSNKFLFGLASFYEIEQLTTDKINYGFRLSSYLQLNFDISKKIQFFTTTYLQPSINHLSDFKFSTESQLNFKISKNLSFTNTLEATYDSYPASDVKELSYGLRNGIKYKF